MKLSIVLAIVVCCLGVAAALSADTVVLSQDEALSTTGAVVIDGRRCNQRSSDCNFYNRVNGMVFTCPTGSGLCSECEINGSWDTCVKATGQSCNWLGSGNQCGALLLGACDVNDECVNLTPLGTCIKAPRCRTVEP